MKTLFLAAAALAALAAPVSAQRDSAPYRAAGTEPFWSVTIDRQTMRYETPDGRPLVVPTPQVRASFNGERYVTRRLTVDITHMACSDGMSDRRYPDTVRVTVDGRELRGCGGLPAAAPTSPLAGAWRIQSIAGRPPVRGTEPSLNFAPLRVSGSTGCNSFSGRYRFERGRLTAGPLMTTRRACAGRYANEQERALLGLLEQPLSVTSNPNGKLVLTGRNGQRLVLAK